MRSRTRASSRSAMRSVYENPRRPRRRSSDFLTISTPETSSSFTPARASAAWITARSSPSRGIPRFETRTGICAGSCRVSPAASSGICRTPSSGSASRPPSGSSCPRARSSRARGRALAPRRPRVHPVALLLTSLLRAATGPPGLHETRPDPRDREARGRTEEVADAVRAPVLGPSTLSTSIPRKIATTHLILIGMRNMNRTITSGISTASATSVPLMAPLAPTVRAIPVQQRRERADHARRDVDLQERPRADRGLEQRSGHAEEQHVPQDVGRAAVDQHVGDRSPQLEVVPAVALALHWSTIVRAIAAILAGDDHQGDVRDHRDADDPPRRAGARHVPPHRGGDE